MTTDFYLKVSRQMSRLLTSRYSTSFTWGIRVFPADIQAAIFSIYGFVRLADEIVDTFHDYNQTALLAQFRAETQSALKDKISTNPILQTFQDVVHHYQIPQEYIEAFLHSMEMDLTQTEHDQASFDKYVYGSAEVVGLMCLKVFCHPDQGLFDELHAAAKALGSAFQKVNFLRDMKSDFEVRGRCYLPEAESIDKIRPTHKKEFETSIEQDFDDALEGIKKLPKKVRLAVYSVYLYYRTLFKKLRANSLEVLLEKRVRISNFQKALLFIKASFEHIFLLS